ncbi:glycosyl transferase family protein [Thiomicrospira microaerophila]|uniref:glycosyl transferase family protein n=1 Tax=Thiomicrospira microaerophila TaxID=406020 RepID=UPI00200ED104|nr:glycosyl transferase family protein [Thiomicrospira microaerophila]UQB41488.1 glycosyl transferase family protein [Thiomicrospira microaerophila]
MADHPFAESLRILGKGPKTRRPLTQDEASQALAMILAGEVTEKQLGAFLLLMRANGETPDELIGFVKGARQSFGLDNQACPAGLHLDWAAYAGKWRYPPYYLLSLKLLAQMGFGILLHGDQGQFAQRQYAQAFLAELNVPIADSLPAARAMLVTPQLVYLPLTQFAEPLREILHLKEEIGVRTVFNTAVKLLNPLNSPVAVQGIFHKGVEQLHLQTAQALGYKTNLVFKGEGGEAEMRPDALSTVYAWQKYTQSEQKLNALIERQQRPEHWDPADLVALWQGKKQDIYGEAAVMATAAVALMGLGSYNYNHAVCLVEQAWHKRAV